MLTYLAIGVSVQVAWIIFTIIRNTTSVKQVKGFVAWMFCIFGCAVNIILWPISVVFNVVASYYADRLKEEP